MMIQFEGVYAVTVTPFTKAGQVDTDALRRHVRWLVDECGVHGVIPAGSTGEFAFLSAAERELVVQTVLNEVGGRLPVVAGAAACSTADTIRFAQAAKDMGAVGVMVVPPYYGHLSQEELYRHFRSLAEAVDTPVMLYNNPGAAGSDILPQTVARLAEVDNIVAIKESSGIMQRVTEIQRRCGDQIQVLCGCDTLPLEMFQAGVRAWVAAPSNVIGRQCVELYQLAVKEGDIPSAREMYFRLLPLFEMFEGSGQYVQLNKAGLAMLGRPVGDPRPPLLPPSAEQMTALRTILDDIYGA